MPRVIFSSAMDLVPAARLVCLGVILSALSPFPTANACGINWTQPTNHFDGVNERGLVSLWETLDTMDLGAELRIPLIIHFRSDRRSISALGGYGWLFPLLESSVVATDERHFTMVQPDGRNRYFSRKNVRETVLKDSGGWVAKIDGDHFVAWAECGWKLEYTSGKLMAITSPKGRRLSYTYLNGRVESIRESGNIILAVSENKEITYQGRRLTFEHEQLPRVIKIHGQNVISEVVPSFHHASAASRISRSYAFGVTGLMEPKVTIDEGRTITWDAETGYIISDGAWKYTISSLPGDAAKAPPVSTSSRAMIERVNASGTKESFSDDKAKGVKSVLTADGTRTVTSYFTTGNMAGNLRQVDQVHNGKTKMLEKFAYDEKGRPLRVLKKDGSVVTHEYQPDGTSVLTRVFPNGKWESSFFDVEKRLTKKYNAYGDLVSCSYSGEKWTKVTTNLGV